MFTVLVCGGREYTDKENVFRVLGEICDEFHLWDYNNTIPIYIRVINGGARGADKFSTEWAKENAAQYQEYKPKYDEHSPKFAPLARNQEMLNEEIVDLVLAFPGGRGTADMVRRAEKKGVLVRTVT
jgi:predicted Rossmann-fold nucleotide-binding protein